MTAPALPSTEGRDPLLWLLAALGAARLTLVGGGVRTPDALGPASPWLDGDSWDWLLNGLFLAGEDVRYSGRAPLLPLAIAGLERLGALPWLPLLTQLLFQVAILAHYLAARRLHGRGPACAAALAVGFGYSFQTLSLDVMADVPASSLLALSCTLLAAETVSLRRGIASGLLAGASALTQQAGLLWLPAAAGALLLVRRDRPAIGPNARRPRLPAVAALAAFTALQLAWLGWKVARVGTAGDLLLRQWALFDPHLGSIASYAWCFASLWGGPAALLIALGIAVGLRHVRSSVSSLHTLLLALGLGAFFVLLYDFDAKRFLVYLMFPATLALAGGI